MTAGRVVNAADLAAIVGKTVKLDRRAWGLCPFHLEDTASFHVFQGRDGKGRYYCHGCGAKGDARDWLDFVEGKGAGREALESLPKPDPADKLRREQERVLEIEYQEALDRHPELPEEARLFLQPDLGTRLRRLLKA